MSIERLLKDSHVYIACQVRCAEAAKEESKKNLPRPFVTISRQAGSGGITIGEMLVQFLGKKDKDAVCPWTLFDGQLVGRILEEHNLSSVVQQCMPEDRISVIQDIVQEFVGHNPASSALVRQANETILHLAHLGNSVIVGRGSNIVTRSMPYGVHVRLVGSTEKRLQHLQTYYKIGRKEAQDLMKKEDEGRKNYIKFNFGKNIDDDLLYDFVINTDSVTYEDVVHVIGHKILETRRKILASVS